MNTRKIQKTGGASFTITLPKEWLKHWNLSEKSFVDFYEILHGPIVITPHDYDKTTKGIINIEQMTFPEMEREIIGLYVSGAGEIVVQSQTIDSLQRSFIRSICNKLFGFELFDSVKNQIVIKNVSNSVISVNEYITRMLTITTSMLEDCIRSIKDCDIILANDVVERDIEIDRIHLLIDRIFHTNLRTLIVKENHGLSLQDISFNNTVGIRLERIADHVVRMAKSIACLKECNATTVSKNEIAIVTKTLYFLRELYKVVNFKNRKAAHELIDNISQRELYEYKNRILTNKSTLNLIIEDSAYRIQSYIINIAEEIINHTSSKKMYQ